MRSLRQSIAYSSDRSQVPAFAEGDIGDLGGKLGLTPPFTMTALIHALDLLPPALATIDLGTVSTPGGVSGSGQIGLQSDGTCSFKGFVSNPSSGGINYVYAVALLDIKDSHGNVLVFSMSGNLYNAIQGSSRHAQQDSFAQSIADNWDIARTSRYHTIIADSTNILEDVLGYIAGALAVIGTFGIVLAIPAAGPGGPGYDPGPCQWIQDGSQSNPNMTTFGGCYRIK